MTDVYMDEVFVVRKPFRTGSHPYKLKPYATLAYAQLSGQDLWRVDLSHADLWRADLSHANCFGVSFRGCDCRGANFTGSQISYADFTGALCEGATFEDCDATGVVGLILP